VSSINNLDDELDKIIGNFSIEAQSITSSSKCNEDVKYDLEQISRQVFYMMVDFQKSIIEHLKRL